MRNLTKTINIPEKIEQKMCFVVLKNDTNPGFYLNFQQFELKKEPLNLKRQLFAENTGHML